MIDIRKSEDRGYADHGWLKAYHSFSFADYYDPENMGFRALRVINEDRVQAGKGFGTHGHRDMEIVTYVLEGTLEHKDSMGNGSLIRPGEAQYMSAGSGVTHSEFNHSKTEGVHLLQIWILPNARSLEPRYDQKTFSTEARVGKLCQIASPDGADGSIAIRQDVRLYATILDAERGLEVTISRTRFVWIQVARGAMTVNGQKLKAGDAARIAEETKLQLVSSEDGTEFLFFDLA